MIYASTSLQCFDFSKYSGDVGESFLTGILDGSFYYIEFFFFNGFTGECVFFLITFLNYWEPLVSTKLFSKTAFYLFLIFFVIFYFVVLHDFVTFADVNNPFLTC